MSSVYRPPWAFSPPLAYGGHCWALAGRSATCSRCHVTVPRWALTEGLWMVLAARWCPRLVRALPAGPQPVRQLDLFPDLAEVA